MEISNLSNVLSDLYLDEAIEYRRLRLVPLGLHSPSDLDYMVFDGGSDVTVEETSVSGTVPELLVQNRSIHPVLVPEGTTLTGARQNRVVNLSVLLGPESTTKIPVSCVERGRWTYHSPSLSPSWTADSHLRAMMCGAATASLKNSGTVHVDQGAVWNHVEQVLDEAHVTSPTRAYHALHESLQTEIHDYEANLRVPSRASGIAVELDGKLQSVDLFDKPQTLSTLWPRLIKSYIMAALRPGAARGRPSNLGNFLAQALSTPADSFEPVGLGKSLRIATADAVGAGLFRDTRLIHLSLFAQAAPVAAQAATTPTSGHCPPSTETRQAGEQQRRRSHPWWRFWM
jgi:hypothetical protein